MFANRSMRHWHVLAAVGAINWSGFFIYDIPASLSTPLQTHLNLPSHRFSYLISLLYTVYAIPNAVLPLFSSAAIQRFGERRVLIFTVSSMMLGQMIFATGIHAKLPAVLVLGRGCIGLGGEVVAVVGVEIVSRGFEDKNLSLALAINLCMGRLGSVANTILVPRFIEYYGIVPATWIATGLVVGVAATGATSLLVLTSSNLAGQADDKEALVIIADEDRDSDSNGMGVAPSSGTRTLIRHFPSVYWQLALICILTYGCVNSFTNSAQRFLAARFYRGDQQAAGSAMSIMFTLSGLLVPPTGSMLDRFSSRSYPIALITSNLFLALAHAIFMANNITSPILPLILIGVADALFGVSLWASVVRCLSPKGLSKDGRHCKSDMDKPLLKGENMAQKGGYESIRSVSSMETLADNEVDQQSTDTDIDATVMTDSLQTRSQTQIRTLGLGIMSSLMNLSTAAVPVPLAAMENLAGFDGVEGGLFLLGVLGVLASGRVLLGGGLSGR
ncbi:major facilitator superfamily domain-containing protein [Aspergillus stella-maris]|uniref:major facilitator superfamily domain-containing protein n=1 Tax=Aspergillus stella-maris TaxID=1810926 RepID=UPI003CCCA054